MAINSGRNVEVDETQEEIALHLICYPFLHASATLIGVLLLLFAPDVLNAWQSGSLGLGQFGGELQALDIEVKQSKVEPGWTIATFPHPLQNVSGCHNPPHRQNHNNSKDEQRVYFCDPDGVLDVYEASRVTERLLSFQESTRVSCALGADNDKNIQSSPFFIGIALMHRIGLHYGEPEVDPAKCASDQPCLQTEIDWFGDGLVHLWQLDMGDNRAYCPRAAVIVLVTEKDAFRVRLASEYFVNAIGAKNIERFMDEHFKHSDWEGGIIAGIDAFQKYFDSVYFNKGYSSRYWWITIGSGLPLAVGLAAIVFGQSRNERMNPAILSRGDACCGLFGCCCYLVSALLSTAGVYVMKNWELFWDPGASGAEVYDLMSLPLYAGLLSLVGVPCCCPLSFGSIIRDSRLNKCNLMRCFMPPPQSSAGPENAENDEYAYQRVEASEHGNP